MTNPKVIDKVELEPEVEDVLRPSELPIPAMNMNLSQQQNQKEENPLVTNDQMIDMYKKIFDYIEDDRKVSDEVFRTLLDMSVNDGDASSSTKEVMAQVLKLKMDSTDKMTKIYDLLMRYILKERDTFPRYLAQNQENKIIFKGDSKRAFLERVEKAKARKIEDKKG